MCNSNLLRKQYHLLICFKVYSVDSVVAASGTKCV